MECDAIIRGLVGDADDSGVCVSCWDRHRLNALDAQSRRQMADIINVLGRRSCKAQALGATITDWTRMASGSHRIYIAARTSRAGSGSTRQLVLGFLKTGRKNLFLRVSDMTSMLREVEPLCVLDFYVHESLQRQGVGLKLMRGFFQNEGVTAEAVAYDRPSNKLISFLGKHFGLQDYVNQTNNFVVFRRFWDCEKRGQQMQQHARRLQDRENDEPGGGGRRKRQDLSTSGAAWSTISQRPLSGTRQQRLRRHRRQSSGQSDQQPLLNSSHSQSPHRYDAHHAPVQSVRGNFFLGDGEGAGPNVHVGGVPQYGRRAHGTGQKDDLCDVTASVHKHHLHHGGLYGVNSRQLPGSHQGHHQQRRQQQTALQHLDDYDESERIGGRLPMYGRRADVLDTSDSCKFAHSSSTMTSITQPSITSLTASANSRSTFKFW